MGAGCGCARKKSQIVLPNKSEEASELEAKKKSSQTAAEAVETSIAATTQVKLPKAKSKEESTNSLKNGVDKNSNSNCFFLSAKHLSISWAEDNRYWRWSKIEETRSDAASDTAVDVAELLNVCWLEVRGKFETTTLSEGTTFEVAYVIMMKEVASGWEVPVNVRLILPDGNKQERKEDLMKKPRGEWIEIPVGEFVASPEKAGEIEFSIYEHGGQWKRGLVIKGIAIRPKN